MNKQPLWSKDFVCITLCNLFLFLAFYYLIVTLPIFTLQELNGSEAEAGLLITAFLITAILIRPLASSWAITIGNKALLFIGLVIFLISSVLYLIPDSVLGLIFVRLLHGIGFGLTTTAAGAIVANVIPETRRGEGMGYYSLSFNIAVVVGPFLGLTAMHQSGRLTLFSIVILVSFLSLVMALFISKEEKISVQQRDVTHNKQKRKINIFEKTAVRISIVAGLFAIIYSSILSFVPVYAEKHNLLQVSSFFFVVYAAVMLLSRPFTGRWLDQYGANVIVYPAILIFSFGMFLLSISETAVIFLMAAAFIGLGWGSLFPTFQTISVQQASPERRGLAMATFLSLFDLGIGVGSFIVGIVVAKTSIDMFYFYGSFILLLGIGVYNIMHGRYILKKNSYQKATRTG